MNRPPLGPAITLVGLSAGIPFAAALMLTFLSRGRYNGDQTLLLNGNLLFGVLLVALAYVLHGANGRAWSVRVAMLTPLAHAAYATANFVYLANYSPPIDIFIYFVAMMLSLGAFVFLGLAMLGSIDAAKRYARQQAKDGG